MQTDGRPILDFLIVGAAKAGTTALYRMLEEHPSIFLPKNKEPKIISSQFVTYPLAGPGDSAVEKQACKTLEEFGQLYAGKGKEQISGEGSIDNLYYHEKSIPLIREYFGDPKILIMLRNPVERAYSAYYHLVRDGRETLSFSDALEQESVRNSANWQFLWSYFSVGLYASQVASYLQAFSQVKVIIYEDFVAQPEEVVKDVYTFLGVESGYVASTGTRHNISGIPKNRIYKQLLYPDSPVARDFKRWLRSLLGKKVTTKLRSRVKRGMLYKPPMDTQKRKELVELYTEDIQKLSLLIERDLSSWMS